jgi:hypothetical protein
MNDLAVCARIGCVKGARWMPTLTFTALGDPAGLRARCELMNVALCDDHILEPEVIIDALWPAIVASLVARDMKQPDRASAVIEFE